MNKKTVERLSGFARLWGNVYLFHPKVGRNEVDLGPPTLKAIDSILAASDKASFVEALETFLRALKDPSSKVQGAEPSNKVAQRKELEVSPGWHFTRDGVAVLPLRAFESLGDGMYVTLREAIRSIDKPRAIVLDVRGCGWWLAGSIIPLVRHLIPRPILPGSTSWRRHSGWASESGLSTGGYYSSVEISQPSQITASRWMKERPVDCPIVILATGDQSSALSVGVALWHAGLGGLVLEGEAEVDPTITIDTAGVSVKLCVGEWINPDGSIGFKPTVKVKKGATKAPYLASTSVRAAVRLARSPKPVPRNHARTRSPAKLGPVPDQVMPDTASRVFAWFKFWNVIKYLFPYHHLTDRPWEEALSLFIPRFIAAQTPAEYALAAAEACTWMDDSHAGLSSPGWQEVIGDHYVPAELRMVEERFVVTALSPEAISAGLSMGDVVEAVDGIPAERAAEGMRTYLAHSTEQGFYRAACNYLLAGKTESVELTIRRGTRVTSVTVPRQTTYWTPSREGPVFQVLPEGFGYVDLVRLDPGDVDKMLRRLQGTPALIIDIRGYPRGAMFDLAPHMTSSKVVGALFTHPEVTANSESTFEIGGDSTVEYRFAQTISPAGKLTFQKPVVALIDERAISQSEHSCLFLEAVADVTFIGTPTIGANGDVTSIALPGRMSVVFTGFNVTHADGRQLQRVGILPDIKVAPTIGGIRSGRDEVLEAAISHLQSVP